MAETAPALALEDVDAGYGETVVLDAVSLTVAAGEHVGIIGRNGVGKTTSRPRAWRRSSSKR